MKRREAAAAAGRGEEGGSTTSNCSDVHSSAKLHQCASGSRVLHALVVIWSTINQVSWIRTEHISFPMRTIADSQFFPKAGRSEEGVRPQVTIRPAWRFAYILACIKYYTCHQQAFHSNTGVYNVITTLEQYYSAYSSRLLKIFIPL